MKDVLHSFQKSPENKGKVTNGTEKSVKATGKEVAVLGSQVTTYNDTGLQNNSTIVAVGMGIPAIILPVKKSEGKKEEKSETEKKKVESKLEKTNIREKSSKNTLSSNPINTKKSKSRRLEYMGRTPSKKLKTGREVIARMKKEGKIKGNKFKYKEKWYDIKDADMGHKIDAVTWWNKKGRFSGPKSKRVRNFMKSPYNYELQPKWINRSNGAKLKETYLPPVIF